MQYSLSEARNQLSKLAQDALAGEDVVITRNGIPLVRLVKINTPVSMRKPGAWAGLSTAPVDWNVPVSLSKDPDLQKVGLTAVCKSISMSQMLSPGNLSSNDDAFQHRSTFFRYRSFLPVGQALNDKVVDIADITDPVMLTRLKRILR